MTILTPSRSRSINHSQLSQDRLLSPTRGKTAAENSSLYTTVDNLILPGVIGATVEGPKTPIRSPKTRRVYNYFSANNTNPADRDYDNSNNNNHSMTLPYASDSSGFPLHRTGETSHRSDSMATSRYVDAEVPLENRVSAGGRRGNSSDDPDDMDDPQHGYSTPQEGKRYRKNFRPHDTPIALSKRAFNIHTRNHNSNGQRSEGHASPSLRHSSPQRHLTLGVRETESSESSDDDDQEDDVRETFTSRTPTRGASQETAQRVPVSLELDMDQESYSQDVDDNRATRYEDNQPLHYRDASLQGHSGDEGLDIGGYEDELYPHERLRGHSHGSDGAEDNTEASDEVGLAAQLAHEAEEQRKEREQLGFIKRWASLLRKQRDEFGWGTPKRQPGYQSPSSESDSDRSFTSARVRKGLPKRRNSSFHTLNQASTTPRTPPPNNRTTSNTPKKDLFSVPSMRQMDSGIGGSQDSYDEHHDDTQEMEDEDEHHDQEPFQPLQRSSSSARQRQLDLETEDALYESLLESEGEQDRPDYGDTLDDMSHHPSSFGRRAPNTSQINHRQRAVREPLNGRRHARPSLKHHRVYPWHVIWRMLQGYGRSLEDFIHRAAALTQLWFWVALSWIRFTVEWPWSQRHKLKSTAKSWMDAGVDSGLLSPGTLFGVAVLILALWGGHSLGLGELSSDSTAYQKRQDCDNDTLVQRSTSDGGLFKGMMSNARERFSWSSSRVDPQEQLRPRFPWRDWIPQVPSIDVWSSSRKAGRKSTSPSPSSSANKIQIPTDQIQSFQELQSSTARWENFLQENESAMAAFVEDRMSMVSKGVFLNLVKEEANQIWQGLEKKVVDLLEKQGKLQGRHAPSRVGHYKSSDDTRRPLTEVERELITELIDEALDKYSADAMAKPDYALFTAGGRIIPGLTSPNYRAVGTFNILGRIGARMFQPLARKKALEPDMHAGECWPMEGSDGQLAIRLAREIVVTEVTIEHADPSVVLDMSSAPREIEVWSLREGDTGAKPLPETSEKASTASGEDKEGQKTNGAQDEQKPGSSTTAIRRKTRWNDGIPWPGSTLLTSFEYEASMTKPNRGNEGGFEEGQASTESTRKPKSRQTFAIPLSKQTTSSVGVALRIKSNWGHPKYTCVYRVRVHGYEPDAARKSS
ncbi:hypothetical protein BGZ72_006141 [Mortierella alpina]|nr:hypothetical protein BGZ72_006141 [Mortierella alpina]